MDGAFAPDGAIASAIDGFEPRAAQREMAGAVAATLEGGGVLLAEAGTGTGKTLAYLVPAILKRERVLVSTGTKNLQEQIYFKDLPVLERALGVPFKATCMKGRGNYLCLHRYAALHDQVEGGGVTGALPGFTTPYDARMFLAVVGAWAARTETGDRAEIEDLPEDLPLWNDVAASAETCLGSECPRYDECFVTRMRRRAEESDVVIVNHHLLFADASVRLGGYGAVIPECRHAVLDEAHQLEDVATQYFGVTASTWRVEELASDIERWAAGALRAPQREAIAGWRRALAATRAPLLPRARRCSHDARGARAADERRARPVSAASAPTSSVTLDGLEGDAAAGRQQPGDGGEPQCRERPVEELLVTRTAREAAARRSPVPAARRRQRLRVLPRSARARCVPAGGAYRRVTDRARVSCSIGGPPPC